MTRRIQDEVAKNSRGRRRIETTSIEVSTDSAKRFNFTGSEVTAEMSIRVYTRPITDMLVFGHPDAANGFGRGRVGDHRDDWTLVEDTTVGAEFTKGGRTTIVDALAGSTNGLATLLIGASSNVVSVSNDALGDEEGSTSAWGTRSGNVTTATGSYRFSEFGPTVAEFGVESEQDEFMARLTVESISPADDVEIKAEADFTFEGDGQGNAVITNDGEEALANSIRSKAETVGLYEMAIGSSGNTPAKSDSALATEIDRKKVSRSERAESVRAFTRWYDGEPSSQPVNVSNFGLFDFDGRLVWHGITEEFEKNDGFPLEAASTIRVI